MSITATMVKELREVSGAGMMDAKKALTETGGDMEAAIDWLQDQGPRQGGEEVRAAPPPRAWSASRSRAASASRSR